MAADVVAIQSLSCVLFVTPWPVACQGSRHNRRATKHKGDPTPKQGSQRRSPQGSDEVHSVPVPGEVQAGMSNAPTFPSSQIP